MDRDAYFNLTGFKLVDVRDNWKSICPCHFEKTPSFFIHKETLLCHCFGCGVKGWICDVLAREYELDREKVRKQLGIPFRALGPEKPRVQESFNSALLAGFPRIQTHSLLKRRGFKTDIIMYHSARWDQERKRIVFPLQTFGGPTQGAVGRTVTNDTPKWYFYWGTRPGTILYQAIDTLHLNIIVEGVLDVMWMNQNGYPGAAAILGSEATKIQKQLIKDNVEEICLFLDNDEAGRIGTENLARSLRSSITVTIAKYPDGRKDPQEMTREELYKAIEDRQSYVEFASSKC